MKIYIESTEDIILRIEKFFEKEKEEVRGIIPTLGDGRKESKMLQLRNAIPVEDRIYTLQKIALDDSLYTIQGFVNYKNMIDLVEGGPNVYNKPIRVIRYDDKHVISDGNHRATLAIWMNQQTIMANVLDLEENVPKTL